MPDPKPEQPSASESTKLDTPDPAQHFGAAAAEDAELVDELTRDAGGDLEQAESRFDDEQRGPVSTETASPADD